MLNSQHLQAFFVVAQTGNFTRAADRLHLTQSALSQRIRNLEQELEISLFVRGRTGVQLTEAGFALLRHCQARQGLESDFLNSLRPRQAGKYGGEIRIGAYSSVMNSVILPCLAQLLAENPAVQLHSFTRELAHLPNLLKRGEADFIVLNQALEQEGIATITLGSEHYVLVQAKGYSGGERYLDHDEADQTTRAFLRLRNEEMRGTRLFLNDIHGVIRGVELGMGRAVLPRHLLANDSNFTILWPRTVLQNQVVLHYHTQTFYSRLHQAVVSVLTKNSARFL